MEVHRTGKAAADSYTAIFQNVSNQRDSEFFRRVTYSAKRFLFTHKDYLIAAGIDSWYLLFSNDEQSGKHGRYR
jgi:hypothetical protein